jgi:ribosomal protein S18 acetylase RimI-like enzyme
MIPQPVTFRPAMANDAPALAQLGRDTFCETFAHLYRPEDLSVFLAGAYTIEAVAAAIADPAIVYRLAEQDGQLIGYAKLAQQVGLDFPTDTGMMELKQLYVRSTWHGSGLGKTLMNWVLAEARQRGARGLVLSVWQGNHKAQAFYARYGFTAFGETYFMVGTQRDDEFVYGLKF